MTPEVLAQIENWAPFVAQIGFPSVVAVLMLTRFDSRLGSIEHRLVGVQRTLLIELLSRETISLQAKTMARQELEKLDNRKK